MGKHHGYAKPAVACLDLPDDDVYPLFDFDDVKSRHCFVTRILRFDDVLDTEMLSASLTKLLQTGDWRKLAGRIQRKGEKRLEVRVPRIFTTERPALTVTKEDLMHYSIYDHPKAKQLHAPTSGPSIQPAPKGHPIFATGKGFPDTVDEMIRRGLPQLSLHMTSFRDATLIALVWPHTLTDAFGVLGLLRAWSLVLTERENEVPPVLGSRDDVLLAAEADDQRHNPEPLFIESLRLRSLGLAKWGLRMALQMATSHKLETRTIFLPARHFTDLISRARQEAADVMTDKSAQPFVSEGDILTAWLTKALAHSEGSPRPITVNGFFNVRARLPSATDFATGVYVQNLLVLTYAPFTAEVLSQSLGAIATAHRQYFREQTTEKQTLAFTRTLRSEILSSGAGRYLFGASDSLPLMVNNFLKADFMAAADFSRAVLERGGSEKHGRPAGMMTTYYYHVFGTPLDRLNTFYMLGKDRKSNCWLQANLRPEAWAKLDEELKRMG